MIAGGVVSAFLLGFVVTVVGYAIARRGSVVMIDAADSTVTLEGVSERFSEAVSQWQSPASQDSQSPQRPCPTCGRPVSVVAEVCRFCHTMIGRAEIPQTPTALGETGFAARRETPSLPPLALDDDTPIVAKMPGSPARKTDDRQLAVAETVDYSPPKGDWQPPTGMPDVTGPPPGNPFSASLSDLRSGDPPSPSWSRPDGSVRFCGDPLPAGLVPVDSGPRRAVESGGIATEKSGSENFRPAISELAGQ